MNKFDQLVADLKSGDLGLTQVCTAIKVFVRESPNTPDQATDLLCGVGESTPGLIDLQFKVIKQTIGAMELACRRSERKKP